eukprot:12773955-Alexandrium_andersonii.AAC.1
MASQGLDCKSRSPRGGVESFPKEPPTPNTPMEVEEKAAEDRRSPNRRKAEEAGGHEEGEPRWG